MKPSPFTYHSPASIDEALDLLASARSARALAGGQSLVPMLNFRLAAPEHLVDLNGLNELAFITEEAGVVRIGAMTRQRDIEESQTVARRLPILSEAIRLVGHRQTRNRGTLGGSLAHLDPAAELPAIAMALDAEILARSVRGERALRMADFARGIFTSALAPDEIITEVRFPAWPSGHGYAFEEFSRRHGDFAIASAAVLVRGATVSITLGGVGPTPMRITAAERHFADTQDVRETAEHCGAVDALEDPTYPAWYRKKLAVALTERALRRASHK